MEDKKPSFKQALDATILWCNAWEEGNLSDEVLADRIAELVETHEGARGFFVISLSSDCPLMDRLPEPLIFQLRKVGESIVDLTTKNLAMSSAMAVHHRRNQDKKHLSGSERIIARCTELLKVLEPNSVKKHLETLLDATIGKGNKVDFLERWGYDNEQKKAIAFNINAIAEN
tara:strand:+ start:252 stop:770 length:519 start_codon:yes stop_codon:yes gene_type:complete